MDEARRNRQWRLARRPDGAFSPDVVELTEEAVPTPADGEALVAVTHLSMDPTIRGWMEHDTYLPKIPEGGVVRSLGVGTVVASRSDRYTEGDMVSGMTGWQEWMLADDGSHSMQVLPAGTDPLDAVGLFGPTGLAAYFGLLEVGRPVAGETVLVSGAAGATGSVAGQIAKHRGCRVIGTAGSDEKCRTVVDEYRFDGCINYRTERIGGRLRELCPDGVDVFFDNVGGDVLEAALAEAWIKTLGFLAACSIAAITALPALTRLDRMRCLRSAVQRPSAMPSPARLTIAPAPSAR
jgi:NADPH-dependent curcumin reductase CurA